MWEGGGGSPVVMASHLGRVRGQSQSSNPIWQFCFFEPAELPNVSHNPTALLSVFTSLKLVLLF